MLKLSVLVAACLLSLTSVKAMEEKEVIGYEQTLKIFAIDRYYDYNCSIGMEIGVVYKDGREEGFEPLIVPKPKDRVLDNVQNFPPCFEVLNRDAISQIFIACYNGKPTLDALTEESTEVAMRTLNTEENPLSKKYLALKVGCMDIRGMFTDDLDSLFYYLSSDNGDSEK